jgi:Type IV pilus assembly protein PilM
MIQRSQESVLCVDFGLDRLTLLEVNAGRVSGWSIRDLPRGVVRNGDPVDASQLAVVLKQTIKESGLSAVRARFTLPDEAAIFRLVELPALPRRHLHRALSYMLDKDVPLPLDRIRWDWDILEKTDIGYRVCLVAAWRDVIDRIARVASEAGLRLELVEPRSLATARALDRDRVVVFDGSAERLQALYLKRGSIPFVDQSPIGRDQETCARTLERLLRKGRTIDDDGARGETVVLGGDLEDLDLPLSMPTIRVSQALEEQARLPMLGLPSGSLLANLGLADEVLRGYRPDRPGIADVNLLGPGGNRQQWLRRVERLRAVSAWRAGSAARQVGSAAKARWIGRVRPRSTK